MPDIRCKWYGANGAPIRGGCPTYDCRFIHPGQRGWDSLPSRAPVRCMFFDEDGKRINGGCRNRNCRFTHPNDPDWEVAVKSRIQPERRSTSISVSSVPRSMQPNPPQGSRLPNSSTDACQSPTEAMRPSHMPSDSRISRSLKISTTDIPNEVGADLPHASSPSPHLVSISSRNSQPIARQSSEVPISALSESTDDRSRWKWKKRITLLTQAHNLVQKLSEIGADLERRIALHSNNSAIGALAGANLETLKDSARQAQINLEGKLNSIISQLVEDDFWPLPISKQSVTSVSQPQPQLSASLSELGRLLDTQEIQLNKVAEMMAKSYQGHVSIVRAQEEGASPTSKRRRLSSKRSSQEPINFQEIMGRLDCLQGKAIELEADKLFDGRLLEEVDDRVDGWLLEKPVIRPLHTDSLKDAVQELDTDLDVLCNELAELDTADLVSQIGTLRLENDNLKQTMELLASDQQSLQTHQASLDQQTSKIMAEIPELQTLSQGLKCSFTDCDKVVVEVKDEVQGHIDAEWARLIGSIQSYHEEMKKNAFALLEPTVLKTDTLYTYVNSRTVTGQHR